MKIISGFYNKNNKEYNLYLSNLQKSAQKLGMEVKIYSDEIKYEKGNDYWTKCVKSKPVFVLNALNELNEGVMWVDADCLFIKKIDLDEVMKDCDIALTLRDIESRYKNVEQRIGTNSAVIDGYLNTGVMFFNCNDKVKEFLKKVIDLCSACRWEQDAFNKRILKYSKMEKYDEIIDVNGCKIKILNCREYNCFYFPPEDRAKILHFKSIETSTTKNIYNKYIEQL